MGSSYYCSKQQIPWQLTEESTNSPPLTEPTCSLPCSQEPATDPYIQPVESMCEIWGFDSGEDDDAVLLHCDTMQTHC
jgi:hypothetical protein